MTEWNTEEFRLKINQLKREECGNNPLLNNNQDIDILLNMARGYLRVTQTDGAATFGLDSVLLYLFSKIERPLLGGVLPIQIILK